MYNIFKRWIVFKHPKQGSRAGYVEKMHINALSLFGGHQRRQRRIMSLHLRLLKLSLLYYPMSAFAVVDVI